MKVIQSTAGGVLVGVKGVAYAESVIWQEREKARAR